LNRWSRSDADPNAGEAVRQALTVGEQQTPDRIASAL
jgi:hypothetical protein